MLKWIAAVQIAGYINILTSLRGRLKSYQPYGIVLMRRKQPIFALGYASYRKQELGYIGYMFVCNCVYTEAITKSKRL